MAPARTRGLGHNTSVPRQAPTTFQLGRIRTRPHRAHGQMNASELDDPDAAVMRVLYHEHAAALLRYALRLTG